MADRNSQLMREMGSKTGRFDPEPPAHYLWQLEHGNPRERFVAWVKSKTVALNHHSPFAVDEQGKGIYIEHAASDLGWSLHTTQNVAYEVHADGRIRLDPKGHRIYLCAEITPVQDDPKRRTEDEDFPSVQREFPSYVIDFIENLPKLKRAVAIQAYSEYWTWHKAGMADAIASFRAISAPIEDSILQRIGFDKKRLEPRRPAPSSLEVKILVDPPFVQTSNGSTNGHLYKGRNGSVQTETASVQTGASLLITDTDTDNTSSSSSSGLVGNGKTRPTTTRKTSSKATEAQDLADQTGMEPDAADQLIVRCRQKDPHITIEAVFGLWCKKYEQVRKQKDAGRFENFIGFMIEAVPKLITEPRR